MRPRTRTYQSRTESAIEKGVDIATGFMVSYLVWLYIIPVFWPEHSSSAGTAFGIVVLFTISSFIRSFFWRRFFENGIHRLIHTYITRRVSR